MTSKTKKTEKSSEPTNPTQEAIPPAGLVDQVLAAIGFMTRLPVPFRHVDIGHFAWAFPIAGALVGIISAGVMVAALALGLPPLAAALIALATGVVITGALHEDGLADCADGFWGGFTTKRRLEIMRDSRIGAYGVLALVFSVLIRTVLLAELVMLLGDGAVLWSTIVLLYCGSRAPLAWVLHLVKRPDATGLAATASRPTMLSSTISLAIPLALAIGILGMFGHTIFSLAIGALVLGTNILVCIGISILATAKIGGANGDCYGAMEQLGFLASLATLCMTFNTIGGI